MTPEQAYSRRQRLLGRLAVTALCVAGAGGFGSWAAANASGPGTTPTPIPTDQPDVNVTAPTELDRVVADSRPVDLGRLNLAAPGARQEQSAPVGTGRPVVFVKRATWCPPCGGSGAVKRVEAAAVVHPTTDYVVVLHGETSERAASLAASTSLPNLRVVLGDETWGAGVLPDEFRTTIPASVNLSASHAVTRVSVGAPAVQRALAAR